MPEYHIVRDSNQVIADVSLVDRLIVTYNPQGFDNALYLRNGEKALIINNYEGSLILIDLSRTGLNKLHIGSKLIGDPHIEVYGSRKEGSRIDLNRIDINYAQARLKELENWRREEYREQLREKYKLMGGYSVPHRLKQLNISPKGLEEKIEQMRNLVARLENQPGNTFISEQVVEIEEQYSELIKILDKAAKKFGYLPRTIISSRLIESVEEVYSLIIKGFQVIEWPLHFHLKEAEDYWKDIDSWGEM